MSGSPLISVVMAAYNGGALIEETIASVLAQSLDDFELVVVDDCSTDDTLARLRRVRDPRVKVIAAPVNGGPVVARNLAFAAARGRYIVGLDQDDLCHPTRFAVQHAYLEANPQVVLVASAVDLLQAGAIRPPRAPLRTSPVLIDWQMQIGNPLVWSSVMFRADAARQLDVFERTDRLYAEDFDLYHRLARLGAIARIDAPLATYRIHAGGASQRYTARMEQSAAAVLAEPYAALFGDEAAQVARLVLHHFAGGVPAPDIATLQRVGLLVEAVHGHFFATRAPRAEDSALIMEEYGRLWWRLTDACVRSGTLSRGQALAHAPSGLALGTPSRMRSATSVLIGTGRALALRLKRT
jgi:hypothetical protein